MEISHQPCPHTDCNSSDAFSWNTEKQIGMCYSCGKPYPSKGMSVYDWVSDEYPLRGNEGRDTQMTTTTNQNITPLKVVPQGQLQYLTYRGIGGKIREFYDAPISVNTSGEPQYAIYKYPNGTSKKRIHPKDFSDNLGFKADTLFGMNLFPAGSAKAVTVTEGEEDCMAAYQMLGSYPVVSLPSANPSRKLLENCKDWLGSFEKIYLSLDSDNKAEKFALALIDLFPGRVYKVNHGSFKDANEFLEAKKAEAYKKSWWGASKYTPENFTSSPEQWEKVLTEERPYEYAPTPVDDLNKVVRGFIKGGITILKALPGTGKTDIFRYWQHDLVVNKGARVAVLHMEEMKSTTGRGLVTYHLKKNVRTIEDAQTSGVSEQTVIETIKTLTADDRYVSFEIDPSDPMESVLSCIRTAIAIYNVDFIFIDHLQRLAYLSGVDNATAALTELAVKMVDLTKRKNVGIIAISHVNEAGAAKYAKAIEEEAIVILEVERDRFSSDPITRNTTVITVSKNRPFSILGDGGKMYYDPKTTTIGGEAETW